MSGRVVCITGIDTDIGKSIATGLLARFLLQQGKRVITQKLCQTGCREYSEDILRHRQIMGMDLLAEDLRGTTCPYIFTEPCSPHLAARLDGCTINPDRITAATAELRQSFDYVLVEGVGGLMVPLTDDLYLVDYLAGLGYSHLLVSGTRLGSINHTLSALEILASRGIECAGIVYNRHTETHAAIAADSRRCFERYGKNRGRQLPVIDMYSLERYDEESATPDFSPVLSAIEGP